MKKTSFLNFVFLSIFLVGIGGLLAACRPTDVQREAQDLMPSDSLSRKIAAKAPKATVQKVWEATGLKEDPMKYPQTVLFGPNEKIYVADVERNRVFVFNTQGQYQGEIVEASFQYPYLAGFRGDTLAVLNRGDAKLLFFKEGLKIGEMSVPKGPMTYARLHGKTVYFKSSAPDENMQGYITKLDEAGKMGWPKAYFPNPQKFWRYAGNLRMWGDEVMSFAGFRPVIDFLRPDGKLDTLALRGFDSPMLPRSRLFLTGEEWNPPLLWSSAATLDSSLFVLNLRPGWLRLDRYNRAGMLREVAEEPKPSFANNWTPQDMDLRRGADGRLEIVVILKEPVPSLRLYRW